MVSNVVEELAYRDRVFVFKDRLHAGGLLADKLQERQGLGPLDPVAPVAQWLKEQPAKGLAGLAIVGHLPFLNKLASLLITDNESFGVVSFQNGAIVKLVPRPDRARYMVQLVITKQLAEQAQTNLR